MNITISPPVIGPITRDRVFNKSPHVKIKEEKEFSHFPVHIYMRDLICLDNKQTNIRK